MTSHPDHRRLTDFSGDAVTLAPRLLGKFLCRRLTDGTVLRRRITETEAYFGEEDTACHAHRGRTPRTDVLYEAGGCAYVYLCYGMHSLVNFVSGSEGEPEAVLIRGVTGADGPGKLTKMLGIDRTLNGHDAVFSDEIWIEDDGTPVPEYTALPRVGIDYASEEDRMRPWRFTVLDPEK